MANEQNTIGLTPAGSSDLKRLMETDWFNTDLAMRAE